MYGQFINNALGNWDQLDICQVCLAELNQPGAALAALRKPTSQLAVISTSLAYVTSDSRRLQNLKGLPSGSQEGMRNGPEEVPVCV